jgi:hypothetical protein
VAFLTDHLGVQPEVQEPEFACPPGFVSGHILRWPGTGVGLRVRTTDDAGNAVNPYVAAWTLTEQSASLGLATEAGLTVDSTRDHILAVYPDAIHREQETSRALQWWYRATDDGGDLLVLGADDAIYRIESGDGCGE